MADALTAHCHEDNLAPSLDSMLAPHEPARRALTFTLTTPRLAQRVPVLLLSCVDAFAHARTQAPACDRAQAASCDDIRSNQPPTAIVNTRRATFQQNRRLAPRQQLAAMGCLVAHAVRVRDTFYCGSPSAC